MINGFKRRFGNLKLKNKLIIMFLMTIVLPVVMLGFYSFKKNLQMAEKEVNYNFASMVRQVTSNLDQILFNIRSNAESIYSDKIISKFLMGEPTLSINSIEQQNELIYQKMSVNNNASVFIFAVTGNIYWYNTYFYPDLATDYRKLDEYRKCKENDFKLVWIPTNQISLGTSVSPESKKDTLATALILKDLSTRQEVGLLEMIVKEEYIYNIYSKVKMTQNSFGFVLDSDGYIISHADKKLLGKKTDTYSSIRDLIYKDESGSISYSIDNREYELLYGTIPVNNWKLVFAIPRNELMKYTESSKLIFEVIAIACIIISLLISIFISRWVSKPIEEIVSVIMRYGKGELSARIIGYERRHDEVGVLTKEVNQMAERIVNLINENFHSEIKMKEAELESLQAQINPHFLYNTLDTINFLARKQGSEEISRIAIALGDLMRISIRKDRNLITVGEELNYVQNYMIIQKARFRDKVKLVIDIDEALYAYPIPKLSLQPLVENALVHGIEMKLGNSTITVSGAIEEATLVLRVTDDGIGLDTEAVQRLLSENLAEYSIVKENGIPAANEGTDFKSGSSKVGLKNVDMRIKLTFGKEYGISVKYIPGEKTVVSIKLPADGKHAV